MFYDIYLVERDTCLGGPPIRVWRDKEWGKVDEATASNLPLSPHLEKVGIEGWRATHSSPTASVPRHGGKPPSLMPGFLMWSMFSGYCFSGLDSSEMMLILLFQCWENLSKVHWVTVFLGVSTRPGTHCQSLAGRAVQFVLPSKILDILCRPQWTGCHIPHVCLGMLSTS